MRRLLIASLLTVSILLVGIPVFAISPPDSGPFITRVDIYRHCLENDDMLIVARCDIPYTSTPNETVTQAFIGRFMNDTTELARVSPYSYYNKGYSEGMFSMYLDATSAPAWSGNYTVELTGSPTLDWGNGVPSVSTPSLNWRATSGTTATQVLMYSHLIAWAEELSDFWNIALTTSTASGTKLSSYGETYFTNAIPGLRVMCPLLFAAGVSTPAYEDVDWQKAQSEAVKGTWPFDWGGTSEWLGLPSDDEVFRTIIGFVIAFVICSIIIGKTGRTDIAILAGYGLLFVLAAPGFISPVIVAGFTFISILGVGLVFILKGA